MFIQIALLCKTLRAAFYGANEWSFFCMNSKMVKEIVPLFKAFMTVVIVAYEYLRPSTSLEIIMFDEPKFS